MARMSGAGWRLVAGQWARAAARNGLGHCGVGREDEGGEREVTCLRACLAWYGLKLLPGGGGGWNVS